MNNLQDYFKLNIIKQNNKIFQVMMNKKGNLIVFELIDNQYFTPQLEDLLAIKDQVYQVPNVCSSQETIEEVKFKEWLGDDLDKYAKDYKKREKRKKFKTGFVTLAVVAGIVITVFVAKDIDNKYHFFNQDGESLETSKTISMVDSKTTSSVETTYEDVKILSSLKEIKNEFKEVITKEDLMQIANNAEWNSYQKDVVTEFIILLPTDQDLFVLRENLLRMKFETYTAEEFKTLSPGASGDFNIESGKIRYIDDAYYEDKLGTLRHELIHATTLLQTEKDGYNIDITYRGYNHYVNELATDIYKASLDPDNESRMLSEVTGYSNIEGILKSYILYYGPEKMMGFLKNGDIDGFVNFVAKDFENVYEHIALLWICKDQEIVRQDDFNRLQELSFETYSSVRQSMSDEETTLSDISSDLDKMKGGLIQITMEKDLEFNDDVYQLTCQELIMSTDNWREAFNGRDEWAYYIRKRIDDYGYYEMKSGKDPKSLAMISSLDPLNEIWIEKYQDEIIFYFINSDADKTKLVLNDDVAFKSPLIPSDLDAIKVTVEDLVENSTSMAPGLNEYIDLYASAVDYYNDNVKKQK